MLEQLRMCFPSGVALPLNPCQPVQRPQRVALASTTSHGSTVDFQIQARHPESPSAYTGSGSESLLSALGQDRVIN